MARPARGVPRGSSSSSCSSSSRSYFGIATTHESARGDTHIYGDDGTKKRGGLTRLGTACSPAKGWRLRARVRVRGVGLRGFGVIGFRQLREKLGLEKGVWKKGGESRGYKRKAGPQYDKMHRFLVTKCNRPILCTDPASRFKLPTEGKCVIYFGFCCGYHDLRSFIAIISVLKKQCKSLPHINIF